MQPIEIQLDPTSPEYSRLQAQLRENLSALKTVTFRTRSKPAPAGTLVPGAEQIVAFIIEHYDNLIPLATALVTLLTKILGTTPKSKAREKKPARSKPAVIVVGPEVLHIPSSQAIQKRFLKKLQSGATSVVKQAKAGKHKNSKTK